MPFGCNACTLLPTVSLVLGLWYMLQSLAAPFPFAPFSLPFHLLAVRKVMQTVRETLRPEFFNRVDEFVIFDSLSKKGEQMLLHEACEPASSIRQKRVQRTPK